MRAAPWFRRFGVAALAAAGAVLVVLGSLWPLDFRLPVTDNGVSYGADGTLAFTRAGIARLRQKPGWLREPGAARPLVFSVRLRSFAREQSGPARILTISRNPRERNLTIGQDGTSLVLRVRTRSSDANGQIGDRPVIEVPDAFSSRRWLELTVRITPDAVSLAHDGTERRHLLTGSPFGRWARGFPLAFGNELTNDRPWLGEIAAADACAGADCIDLLAPESLRLPRFLWVHPRPQLVPTRDYGLRDAAVNYAGYIPLGILAALTFPLRRRGLRLVAALACIAAFSATMEVLQVFVPSRHPSVNDALLNLAGAATGMALAFLASGPAAVARR